MTTLGKTLMVANPTAQSGKGLQAAIHATQAFETVLGKQNFDVEYTQSAWHAAEIVEHMSDDYQTLVVLGGDGVIHEAANGMMKRQPQDRPVFSIIPVGSGNDYAKSLGISEKIDKAIQQTLLYNVQPADVGCVNGEYFVETLSFGLDAAIAIDTMERRKYTDKKGAALYFESGMDILRNHLDIYEYDLAAKDVEPLGEHELKFLEGQSVCDESLMFAVQIGRTYGGGFIICPEAKIDDGLFDVCIAHPKLSVASAIAVFAIAMKGHHTGLKRMEFGRCSGMKLSFNMAPPCQADGEKIEAKDFDISMNKHALRVVKGQLVSLNFLFINFINIFVIVLDLRFWFFDFCTKFICGFICKA